ncbi:MAG: hypothetical protein Q9217_000735 [Psora testacea]
MTIANMHKSCHGIYKQIGPGERTALSKLAVQHLESTGQPFRIAIDISIWQFQIQSGQGGQNPALRTLYYRLLRLLALSIRPLFVFDGPNRPPFKRGTKIAPNAAHLDNLLTKHLLRCFGFPYHHAPGEAEAECALLQREGIVDAVLSEDVDTLMFGCSLSLRNWTAEGVRGTKSPTHIDVYRSTWTKERAGLDSEGMILVALMSGGDYMQAGIPGCGIKIACQAAKAGFGTDLCRLSKDDHAGLQEWRNRLQHELRTNESGYFLRKHNGINIPEAFPDTKVFSYYTHPIISSPEKHKGLRATMHRDAAVNVSELRLFVSETFNWRGLNGAKHFVRGLAPVLLVNRLIERSTRYTIDRESMGTKVVAESTLIRTISGRRASWITDGEPELRIAYVPAEIVGLDLEAESMGNCAVEKPEDNDLEEVIGSDHEVKIGSKGPTKGHLTYNPTHVEKRIWVLETFVKLGVPLLAETYEEDMRDPMKFATRKAKERKTLAKCGMKQGAIEQFTKSSKPGVEKHHIEELGKGELPFAPPVYFAPAADESIRRQTLEDNRKGVGKQKSAKVSTKARYEQTHKRLRNGHVAAIRPSQNSKTNPWTLAKKALDAGQVQSPSKCSGPNDDKSLKYKFPEGPAESVIGDYITPRSKARTGKHVPCKPDGSRKGTSEASQNTIVYNEADLLFSTPKGQYSTTSPPRRKQSPLQLSNTLYQPGQLRTPEPSAGYNDPTDLDTPTKGNASGLTPSRQVNNRRQDFSTPYSPAWADSPCSKTDSFPSLPALLSPPASQQTQEDPPTNDHQVLPAARANLAKRLVAVRESLEGAWKQVGQAEAQTLVGRKVYDSVEVVDLATT